MADTDYRRRLGQRIKALRKKQQLTQKELAQKLNITFGQLNKYESGLNSPSPELLVRIADRLKVRLDYLMTGHQLDDMPLKNMRLIERLKVLESLSQKDQEMVIDLIDAIIVKSRAQELLDPFNKEKKRAG